MARLRRATVDDLPTLIAHRRGMWEDMGGHTTEELDAHDRDYRHWARVRLRRGELLGWIVEEKGAPVASGCVWVMRIHPRPGALTGETPYLLSMYTAPAARGRGHAKRIVKAAMAWAKKEGYPRMTLHASTMGRRLYESLGWEPTSEMRLVFGP